MFTVLIQNWDIILFAVLASIHIGAWWAYRSPETVADKLPQRELGATTMSSTATAGITAVSILIPASLLVIQLGRGDTGASLPPAALDQVFRGTLWLLLSLILGLYLIYRLPMRAAKYDVGRDAQIGWPYGLQLIALLVGIGRIVQGLAQTIYG